MSASTWFALAAVLAFLAAVVAQWVAEKVGGALETLAGTLGLLAFVFGALAYATWEPAREPQTVAELLGDSLKDHQPGVRELIAYRSKVLWDDTSAVPDIARTFQKIGRWMMQKPESRLQFDELWLRQWLPTQDIYGTQSESVGLTLAWSAADIRRIHWDKLVSQQLLELAELRQMKPVVAAGVVKWCNGTSAELAPRFCVQVAARRAKVSE